jgi:Flp pilus assembly protein TadD
MPTHAVSTPVINDAKFYRERGMAAYHKGDLAAAVADLDRAIQLDPKLSGAYADRGIIFYRMHKFDRAFADVASAKRIDKANRAVMDALARKQPLRPLKLEPPKLTRVSQRRTSMAE